MAEVGVEKEKAIEIKSSLKFVMKPFDGLETLYQQEKYYADELDYLVRN